MAFSLSQSVLQRLPRVKARSRSGQTLAADARLVMVKLEWTASAESD